MLRMLETVPDGNCPSTLDELAGEGARRMVIDALGAEVADYVERHRAGRGVDGRAPGGAQRQRPAAASDDGRRHGGGADPAPA